MNSGQPDILVPREGEAGLLWAIVVSGVVHAATIVAVIVLPGLWQGESTPSVSYTVDLVASADPAGTNLTAGRNKLKPQVPAAAPPAPPPVAAKPPEPVEPQVREQVEPEVPKPQAVVPPPPPVAPPVVEPKPPVVKPQPAPVEKADVKLASKTTKPTPPKAKEPEPTAVVARATAPAVKPTVAAAKPTVVAAKATAPAVKPTAPAVKPTAVVAQKPNPSVLPTVNVKDASKEAKESEAREKQIAAAVQRRIEDQKIADAVERRAAAAKNNESSGGVGGTASGGPISVGSGTGSGGVVEGLDMILYRGQMERRIKENWVWAGEDLRLEVKVQFDVTSTGEIQNVRVTGPSGNASYDNSAMRAVRAASPLAPPPEKYRDLFVHGVELTFRAQDLQS